MKTIEDIKKTTYLNNKVKLLDVNGNDLNLYDWEVDVLNDLENPKYKKIWLVQNTRKTGVTYFSKLILYFRPANDGTFVISHNLHWSKGISKNMPITFKYLKSPNSLNASNFLTPVTLFSLEEEINKNNDFKALYGLSDKAHYDCLYDGEFNVEKYKVLCSYNFDLLIINVSPKDLEKALPFIEQDKDKEDVYIKYIK